MKIFADKSPQKRVGQSISEDLSIKPQHSKCVYPFFENRPETIARKKVPDLTRSAAVQHKAGAPGVGLNSEVVQRQTFDDLLKNPTIMDSIMKNLAAKDLQYLGSTNRASRQVVAPVARQVLAQEMFEPPAGGGAAPAEDLKSTLHVEHIRNEPPLSAGSLRKKIEFLAAKKQIATRALNERDAQAILSGEPMRGKGASSSIAEQVDSGKSKFLSASEKPMHKFSRGSAGHVAIKRPEHYSEKLALSQKYESTVKPPSVDSIEMQAHKGRFKSHDTVMAALSSAKDSDQDNARKAHEVMFEEPLPLTHVVNLDGGLPQGEHVLSKQAMARRREKEDALAKKGSVEYRTYKSHDDARAKMGKNKSLGTKYKIKGEDRIYDLSEQIQDSKKKKGRRR